VRVLIADDDRTSRRVLEARLREWGHAVVAAGDGNEAWQVLQAADAPALAILDWQMPGMDGTEVCRHVRARTTGRPTYIILLTSLGRKEDIVHGLEAGADDYVTKPFDPAELRARVQVGTRVLELQSELAARVQELEAALASVKQLQGLLPMCMYCKKIRDDGDYWHQVENYVEKHSGAQFSHGVCPECYEKILKPQIDGLA
jgi:phosphoserine phosphatase RsbU/P